jgi:hypothetical protein
LQYRDEQNVCELRGDGWYIGLGLGDERINPWGVGVGVDISD